MENQKLRVRLPWLNPRTSTSLPPTMTILRRPNVNSTNLNRRPLQPQSRRNNAELRYVWTSFLCWSFLTLQIWNKLIKGLGLICTSSSIGDSNPPPSELIIILRIIKNKFSFINKTEQLIFILSTKKCLMYLSGRANPNTRVMKMKTNCPIWQICLIFFENS